MTTIASCGHDISNEDGVSLDTMDFTTDWENECMSRCVRIGYYCDSCAKIYEGFGIVLHSLEERDNWLSGKTPYPTIDIHA